LPLKTCKRCGGAGPFSRDKTRCDGLQAYCRACVRKYNAAYTARNAEANRSRAAEWQKINKEKRAHIKQRYAAANRGRYASYTAKRRAILLNAMPKWVDPEDITFVYEIAKMFSMTVDHIMPLQAKNSCGLHVPWNLQLMTKEENCAKHNRTDWPQ
jgi:hypothetical protein